MAGPRGWVPAGGGGGGGGGGGARARRTPPRGSQEHEPGEQRAGDRDPEDQGDVALKPLEETFGEPDADGLGLCAHVTHRERNHERGQGERSFGGSATAAGGPEQAGEPDPVRSPVG